ncbi:prolyl oligopeptidase family serine peptidase [Novosphingobium lentum]|uniref:prolyl oligopeptidase family serine peptidase n=1 Tax=Novosphingobium lentum TaxID=145287 RepID=UPI000A01EB12
MSIVARVGAQIALTLALTFAAAGPAVADPGALAKVVEHAHGTAGPMPQAPRSPLLDIAGYPATRRDAVVDKPFGQSVADPYRWLEADVHESREVADWVARENALSADYLQRLPGRDVMAARIRDLLDYERFSIPRKAGGRYFYMRNSGLQNQAVLYARSGIAARPRVLLDPNAWSADGTIALDDWAPSRKGRFVAYTVQDRGSDWRTLRVLDVATARVLDDRLEWVYDTRLGWVGDEGFFYSRFPAPVAGSEHQALAYNKAVWFHRVGTPQSADEPVYATPDHPEWGHRAVVTSDGRWAVITSEIGTDARRALHVIDLQARAKSVAPGGWPVRELVGNFASDWKLVDGMGGRLWFVTNLGAPRYRLLRIDPTAPDPRWEEVVPQTGDMLENGHIVGDRLLLSYLKDGASAAVVADLKGRPSRAITLNGIGSASGFDGRPGDPETFYQFASFNQPAAVYRLDLHSGAVSVFAAPHLGFDPADYVVEQRYYASRDGTRVPMFVVRSRALAKSATPAPTLLYGYGGFDISLNPGFSAVRMAWVRSGGVLAVANLRGGGEFGQEWHDAGRLAKKQNSFDDFIAAGEYLIAQGITPRGGLAIQGASNGGLTVAAAINQRPDLFAAANPDVGVMDMLRFDRFTAGRFWVDDYGHPDREADWRILLAYSPYHNIHAAPYPAILVTTGDSDDRVVPAHSFKYAAALQAAALGDKPHLIRIDNGAGHGSGKPTEKVIATGADVLSFLAYWTGLALIPPVATPMPVPTATIAHGADKSVPPARR